MKQLIFVLTALMVLATFSPGWALAGGLDTPLTLITESRFKPSTAEKAFFSQAAAGRPGENGIFTNAQGLSAYLPLEEETVLNFHWTGAEQSVLVFDGGTRKMINGTGELIVKRPDDDLVLQRYKGDVRNGLRHGHGELLAREASLYNAFYYAGDFVHGRMEGRGVYVNNDLLDRGGVPFIYKGEFLDDAFHGQGVMTDLETGEVIHSGLWLEGFPFEGDLAAWMRENKVVEVLYAQRRYNDPRAMSQVELAGYHQGGSAKMVNRTAEDKISSLETAKSAGAASR